MRTIIQSVKGSSMMSRVSASVRRWGRPAVVVGAVGLGLAFMLAYGFGREPSAAVSPADSTDLLPMWELSHAGGTLYVLGSVHLMKPGAYPLDPGVYEAFDAAGTVAFELDFAEAGPQEKLMRELGFYPPGRTLSDVLPPAVHVQLEREVARLGVPMAALERMEPWLASLTLTAVALQQAGLHENFGIDLHLHQRAQQAHKAVVGLETVEEQIGFFDNLSPDAGVAMLHSTLEQLGDVSMQADSLSALWGRGDTEGLAALVTGLMDGHPELYETLVLRRNRNWVPRVEALMQRPGTEIVVVGVGHLIGEASLIELLRRRGYEIEQSRARRPSASLP